MLGEISNLSAPFKFATLNPTVRGTLTEDRLPAVRGVLGEEPELVPIRSRYTFPSGDELELTHRMPTVGLDANGILSLAMSAFFGPLDSRIDNDPDHSVRVTTNISFTGTDSVLARTRLYAVPDGRLSPLIEAATGDLSFALTELMMRNDYALQVSDAEVHVELIRESRFAQVVEVSADTVAALGSTLPLTASLRVAKRADRQVGLELAIPDTIPPGVYQLEVASAANLADDVTGGDVGPPGFGPDRAEPGGGFRPPERTRPEPRPESAPDVFDAAPSPGGRARRRGRRPAFQGLPSSRRLRGLRLPPSRRSGCISRASRAWRSR